MLEGIIFDKCILLRYNTNSDEANKSYMFREILHSQRQEKESKRHSQVFPGPLLKAVLSAITGMCMRPAALVGRGRGRHETSYTMDPPHIKRSCILEGQECQV